MNKVKTPENRFLLLLRGLCLAIALQASWLQCFAQSVEYPANKAFDVEDHKLWTNENAWKPETDTGYLESVPRQDSLIVQSAEQNKDIVIHDITAMLSSGMQGDYNETYFGLKNFWSEDIVSNFFANFGQVIGRWLTEFIDGWISQVVQFLAAALRTFVLNPNIAVSGLNGTGTGSLSDDISPLIRQAADIVYSIATDLLLLLFTLAIWRYWADAAWRGDVGLMGAVGRLIFTAGLMLAWPTICAFEIQITNEMIKALYTNSAGQLATLDSAMALAVKGGLVAGVALLASAFAPIVGQVAGGAVGGVGGMLLGTVGGVVSFVGLIIYLILGLILIVQLIYLLVLKAVQTALLTAQYMFAPVFLVCFAAPDTENVTSGFVKSCIEVSLWTFFWVGLLKILVIVLSSDFNPWGKIILTVGILQMMIRVPSFLARAQISPMSNYISSGSVSHGLMNGARTFAYFAVARTQQWFKSKSEGVFDAGGAQPSSLKVNALSDRASNEPDFNSPSHEWVSSINTEVPRKKASSEQGRTAADGAVSARSNERGQESDTNWGVTKPLLPVAVPERQAHNVLASCPAQNVNRLSRVTAEANLLKNIEHESESQELRKKPEELRLDGVQSPTTSRSESVQNQMVGLPGPPAPNAALVHSLAIASPVVKATAGGAQHEAEPGVSPYGYGDRQKDAQPVRSLQPTLAGFPRVPDSTKSRGHVDFDGFKDVIPNVPEARIAPHDRNTDGTVFQGLNLNASELNDLTVSGGDITETVVHIGESSRSGQSLFAGGSPPPGKLVRCAFLETSRQEATESPQTLKSRDSSYVLATKGVSSYVGALIKKDCPAGTPQAIQEKIAFWMGSNLPSDRVNACLSITQNSPIGERECEDIGLVEAVAATGMSKGNTANAYKHAYLNYKYTISGADTSLVESKSTTAELSCPPGQLSTLSYSTANNSASEKQLRTWEHEQ